MTVCPAHSMGGAKDYGKSGLVLCAVQSLDKCSKSGICSFGTKWHEVNQGNLKCLLAPLRVYFVFNSVCNVHVSPDLK